MSIAISSPRVPAAGPSACGPSAEGGDRRGEDRWLDVLAKLIPGEVVIAFTVAGRLARISDDRGVHLGLVLAGAALCPIVLWAAAKGTGFAAHWLQYVVRSSVFLLYGLGHDPVLTAWLGDLEWLAVLGAPVIAVLSALVLAPPGARRPPI
jgi:hypothetical protein